MPTARSLRLLVLTLLVAAGAWVQAQPTATSTQVQILRFDNTDFPGNDLRSTDASSFEQCAGACMGERACRAFTFNSALKQCYLKSLRGTPMQFAGATSGMVSTGAEGAPPAVIVQPIQPSGPGPSCSVASTRKCPGCSVACNPGQKADCTPSIDSMADMCLVKADCQCRGPFK